MRTTLETITPSIAAAWLARNMNNRRPNQRIIDELAAAITAGLWHTTHQGIAFDELGQLIDGQHRLLAIVKAGVAEPFEIVPRVVTSS